MLSAVKVRLMVITPIKIRNFCGGIPQNYTLALSMSPQQSILIGHLSAQNAQFEHFILSATASVDCVK